MCLQKTVKYQTQMCPSRNPLGGPELLSIARDGDVKCRFSSLSWALEEESIEVTTITWHRQLL